jgi:hypothetical protein
VLTICSLVNFTVRRTRSPGDTEGEEQFWSTPKNPISREGLLSDLFGSSWEKITSWGLLLFDLRAHLVRKALALGYLLKTKQSVTIV